MSANISHHFNWLNEKFTFWLKPFDDGGLFRIVFQNCNDSDSSVFKNIFSVDSWFQQMFVSPPASSNTSCYTKLDTEESSRYPHILILCCLWVFILPLLFLFVILVWNFIKWFIYAYYKYKWNHLQSSEMSKYWSDSSETVSSICDTQSDTLKLAKTRKPQFEKFLNHKITALTTRHENKILITYSLTGVALMCLILAGCIHLNISFRQLRRSLDSNTTELQYSLPLSVESAVLNVVKFMEVGLKEGSQTTQLMIGKIENQAKIFINETVVDFGNKLLTKFRVSNLLDICRTLSDSLDVTLVAMKSIEENGDSIFNSLYEFKGAINLNKDLLIGGLKDLCKDLSNRLECDKIELKLSHLNMPIRRELVILDSSKQMKFLQENMNVDVHRLINRLRTTNLFFENLMIQTYISMGEKLSFQLDPNNDISSLLTDANVTLNNLNSNITMYKNVFDSYFDFYSSVQNSLFSLFITLILLTFLFLSIYLIMQIYFCFKSKSNPQMPIDLGIIQTRCPRVTILFIIFISIFLTLFPLVHVILSSLLKTEVCRPTFTTDGVNNTDEILDRFVSSHWPKWITELNASFNISFELSLQPPKEMLYGLIWKCSLPKTSLLSAFNLNGVVDAEKLLKSEKLLDLIAEGEKFAQEFLKSLDDITILTESEKNSFQEALQFTKSFDSRNYEPGIETLKQPITNGSDPHKILQELLEFINRFPKSSDNSKTDILAYNVRRFEMYLLANIPSLETKVKMLVGNFLILKEHLTFTEQIQNLLESVKFVENLLKDMALMSDYVSPVYQEVTGQLLKKLELLLLENVNYLEKTIAQCQPLNSAITIFLNALCNDNNFTESILYFGLITSLWLLPYCAFVILVWYSPSIYFHYIVSHVND